MMATMAGQSCSTYDAENMSVAHVESVMHVHCSSRAGNCSSVSASCLHMH